MPGPSTVPTWAVATKDYQLETCPTPADRPGQLGVPPSPTNTAPSPPQRLVPTGSATPFRPPPRNQNAWPQLIHRNPSSKKFFQDPTLSVLTAAATVWILTCRKWAKVAVNRHLPKPQPLSRRGDNKLIDIIVSITRLSALWKAARLICCPICRPLGIKFRTSMVML